MEKLKFKNVTGTTDSMSEFLKTRPKLEIVKNIISDAIMFSRFSNKMYGALNVFHPKTPIFDFNMEDYYNGIYNACCILKVKDVALDNVLTGIYVDLVCSDTVNDCDAEELALLVLFKWLKEIKKYNSTYKLIA